MLSVLMKMIQLAHLYAESFMNIEMFSPPVKWTIISKPSPIQKLSQDLFMCCKSDFRVGGSVQDLDRTHLDNYITAVDLQAEDN